MAGRPKTRAKLEQQQSSEILDADTAPSPDTARTPRDARAAPTRAHAYGQAGPVPRTANAAGAYVGPHARNVADQVAGSELAELSRALRPGTTVRVERLRPSWAAGWVEDLELDRGGMRELYDHVAGEWGGQKYRLSPLLPSGAAAFSATLAISGPPLHEGRRIDRDEWDGFKPRTQRAVNTTAPAAAAAAPDLGGLLGFFKLFMDTNNAATAAQLESVRELARSSAAQNQDLLTALAERDGDRAGRQTFAAQLGELVTASKALDGVRKVLGGPTRNSKAEAEDDPMAGALKEATKHFMTNAMGSFFQKKSSSAPQHRPPQGPPRRPMPPPPQGIPDAVSSGHAAASRRN